MRLFCTNALLLIGALTTGCRETTAPSKESSFYSLESFNNQPLPAVINATSGDTTILVSATLSLDGAANALIISHSREARSSLPPRDAIDTARLTYHVVGDSIAFYYLCPLGLCALPPFGKSTSSTLTLFYGGSPEAGRVYFYRLLASDSH